MIYVRLAESSGPDVGRRPEDQNAQVFFDVVESMLHTRRNEGEAA
jgi:hypothetical protein